VEDKISFRKWSAWLRRDMLTLTFSPTAAGESNQNRASVLNRQRRQGQAVDFLSNLFQTFTPRDSKSDPCTHCHLAPEPFSALNRLTANADFQGPESQPSQQSPLHSFVLVLNMAAPVRRTEGQGSPPGPSELWCSLRAWPLFSAC
jgi:hypothetical protein